MINHYWPCFNDVISYVLTTFSRSRDRIPIISGTCPGTPGGASRNIAESNIVRWLGIGGWWDMNHTLEVWQKVGILPDYTRSEWQRI